MRKNIKYAIIIAAISTSASCSKSFIDRPSLDGTTVSNYYNTADEVKAATSTLYSLPWSAFENRAMDVIGDVMAGNMYASDKDEAPEASEGPLQFTTVCGEPFTVQLMVAEVNGDVPALVKVN